MHRTNLSPKSSIQKLFWIGSTMFYCWSTKKTSRIMSIYSWLIHTLALVSRTLAMNFS
jgi:hypothetical protein